MKYGEIKEISYKEAVEFLLPKHYSGRIPNIKIAYGWYINNELVSVCTFGKPASPSLCKGICGDEYKQNVYELNRLCRVEDLNKPLSMFVSACLRRLKDKDWIIISYSDTGMNHNGYIYQACNFLYTGCTKQRTDKFAGVGKHSRHYDKDAEEIYRQIRTAKHRYVYFCTRNEQLKRKWVNSLNYKVQNYPKGINKNYILGEYIKPQIIKVKNT